MKGRLIQESSSSCFAGGGSSEQNTASLSLAISELIVTSRSRLVENIDESKKLSMLESWSTLMPIHVKKSKSIPNVSEAFGELASRVNGSQYKLTLGLSRLSDMVMVGTVWWWLGSMSRDGLCAAISG